MKKLAIVLAALLLACVFVGCGEHDIRLLGTWDYIYAHSITTGDPSASTRFEFRDDGTFTTTDGFFEEGVWEKGANTPKEGEWSTLDNVVTIVNHTSTYNGEWNFSFEDGKMIWSKKDNEDKKVTFTKVKK